MPVTNPYGDVELTDPRAMRALAHPVRLAILDHLQRHGPATATQLSPVVDASPSVTSWHLRHLARFGLVRDSATSDGEHDKRQRWWEATATGFRFEAPTDDEGRSAAQRLANQMFLRYEHLPRRWMAEVEPGLEHAWRRLAGLSNTRVVMSAEELEAVERSMEELLAPYVTRAAEDRPAGSRGVRLMRYVMPDGSDDGAGPRSSEQLVVDSAGS